MYKFCNLVGRRRNVPKILLSSTSLFYIHHVFLFPMKLVAYSSAVWQIRCAVKWSMTEGRARLDPLQSYTAITIFSISVGKYPRTGKKIRSNLSEERSGVARQRAFFCCCFFSPHFCQIISGCALESTKMVFGFLAHYVFWWTCRSRCVILLKIHEDELKQDAWNLDSSEYIE